MMKYVGVGLAAALLSACVTLAAISWMVSEDQDNSLATPSTLAFNEDGIDKVEFEVSGQSISLRVFLSKPMNCSQIFETLGIESLPIKEKIYSPTCHKINDTLVKITYIETISV